MSAGLKRKTIEDLKKIVERDYKVSITDNEAKELGLSLLRLSKLAIIGLARRQNKYENRQLSNN